MSKIFALTAIVAFIVGGGATVQTEAGHESTHTPIFASVSGSGGLH